MRTIDPFLPSVAGSYWEVQICSRNRSQASLKETISHPQRFIRNPSGVEVSRGASFRSLNRCNGTSYHGVIP